MKDSGETIAELLAGCEKTSPYVVKSETYKEARSPFFHPSIPVRTNPEKYDAVGHEIFVVSDLHIAAGKDRAGVYDGTENFFANQAFARFLSYANKNKKTPNAVLIINGDIFDFIRIRDHPGKQRRVRPTKRMKYLLRLNPLKKQARYSREDALPECGNWSTELLKLGIEKTPSELEGSVSKKERKFGLRTDDYKTIYKLMKIRHGHPAFFDALGVWLEAGNKLLILKGNHDLELYWPNVRNYLRLILAETIFDQRKATSVEDALRAVVLPRLTFIDDAVVIDDDFYVEHGHRYDKFTMVLDSPELKKDRSQINLPFGSFFNRYLVNRIELFYPFIDNVRPSGNVLPMIMRENFPLGLKILFHHVVTLLRVLSKNGRYLWFIFHKVFWFALVLLLPLGFALYFGVIDWKQIFGAGESSGIGKIIAEQVKGIGMMLLSYLLSRAVAWFQLTEPSSLDQFAKERFKRTTYKIMTMGHTHNPGAYIFEGGRTFYNTGTWVPVIETSTAEVREDRTYTFLHLVRDGDRKLQPVSDGLQRWNDDAERAEPQVLVRRK